MSKIKVHELAKELEKQSKEVIAFLQEKGIEVKAAQSSVEEDAAEMVRKAFGAAKKADAKPEAKEAAKPEIKAEVKTEAKAEPSNEGKKEVQKEAQKEAPKAEGKPAAPVKKKKIIFVSNPHNSNIPGQRSQGDRRPQQNNRQGNNNYNGRPGQNREVPHKIIKPLTAPSQMETSTSDFKQNSRRMDEARAELRASEKRAATEREQIDRRAVRTENTRPDNRPQNRNDNRNENRPNNRPDNRDGRDQRNDRNERNQRFGQNNQGERNNNRRPENGNRFNNQNGKGDFRNNGGDGNRNRGDFNNNRGERSNGGQDSRFKRNEKPGKSFTQDTPPVKDDKRREEEKRRISQEKDKRSKKDFMYEEDEAALKNKNKAGRFIKPEKKVEEPVEEQIKVITIPESLTIKDLADKMKLQPSAIIKKLFLQGRIVTVNSEITFEDAENIAIDYDIICEKEVKVDVIEELLKEDEEKEEDLVSRPPVICVMGHVDHGKTSLLDAIRKTNVTDREAGGITQHIGAYTVNVGGQSITFLDTPGHEAFTAMRMRGANSTDIAILVVAADDGVMPQTVEAINHAKAAGIEIIVAVNKIDKPGANIDRVKQEMTEYELIPVDWGGSTEFVPVSAKTGEGISTLLETVLLTAEIMELKANPNRRARGLVIEAELDKGRGPVATVLVQKGTLHVGDFISAGASHGKVRAMIDDKGRRVKEAKPSTPVEILGLSDVPSAGEVFIAHENDKTAKSYAETYLAQNKEKMLEETKAKMSLDDLFNQIQEGNLKELNLIVKADVQGSVEAVKQSLMKLSNEEVVVKCIHGGVGAINESDVSLAFASSAIIIGFNVRPDAQAKAFAEREGVDIRLYRVIYQAIEDIEAAMKGMLDPVYEEKVIGHAEVRQIFRASAIGNIAGSYVLDGYFQRDCKVRITRRNESTRQEDQIYEGALASLKRFKDDVKEVKAGYECGLVFEGFDQMQELDIVEAYIMVEVPR